MKREFWFLLIYGNLMNFTGCILRVGYDEDSWALWLLQLFGIIMLIYSCIISCYDYRQVKKKVDKIKKQMQNNEKEFEEALKNLKINFDNNTKRDNENENESRCSE